jgi:hypothetical protein
MTTHNKRGKVIRKPDSSPAERGETQKTIRFVSVLILAGIALFLGVKDPVIWAFLGAALGIMSGQTED